ncbi:DUF2339 domain-containing protein [Victivallis vadensis]|uniref:DUF2339 domain-containing protein n=1 Tax=Victivallis vadensis TaxID=172901 RepID=UPI00266C58E5|nr:DUF2339 domain-containing protein [Victivallis vadensis]
MKEIVILAGVAVLIVLVAAICAFFRMLYVQERNHRILQEVLMHLRELRAAGKAAAAPPMPRSREDEKVRKPQDDTSGADAVSMSIPVPVQPEPEKEAVAFAPEAAEEEPAIPLKTEPPHKPVPVPGGTAPVPLPPGEPDFADRADEVIARIWNWITVGEEFRPKNVAAEYAVATTWLVRGGILALLAGIALFLRYAYARNLVPPEARVFIVVLAGSGMVAAGIRLARRKYHLIGMGLLGGGFGTLYFAVYALMTLYKLCGAGTAFGLSILVTAAAMVLAVRMNVLLVALVGVLGGYAAPVLFSTGEKNLAGLFLYLLLLGAGVLFTAWKRNWKLLNSVSFWFTVLLFGGALARFYREQEDYPVVMLFLALFYLLFSMLSVVYNLLNRVRISVFELLQVSANGLLFLIAGVLLTRGRYDSATAALVPLGMAAFYTLLLWAGLFRRLDDRPLLYTWLTLGAASLATAFPLALGRNFLVAAWAAQGVAMIWIAVRVKSPFLRFLGDVFFLLAALRWMLFELKPDFLHPSAYDFDTFSGRLLTLGALTAAAFFAGRLLHSGGEDEQRSGNCFLSFGVAGLFLYLTAETWWLLRFELPSAEAGGVSVLWGLFALAAVAVGVVRRLRPLRRLGLILFLVTVIKIFFYDLARVDSFYRIIAFILLGVALLAGAFIYIKFRDRFEAAAGENPK